MRWTPKLEANLEEMLIRNQFDFKTASKEFERYLNKNEISEENTCFMIDAKTLQLRWTDVEIRRHVIPQIAEQRDIDNADDSDDEDLPPLDETTPTSNSGNPSTKLIHYDSNSGSEEESKTQPESVDLEELD